MLLAVRWAGVPPGGEGVLGRLCDGLLPSKGSWLGHQGLWDERGLGAGGP